MPFLGGERNCFFAADLKTHATAVLISLARADWQIRRIRPQVIHYSEPVAVPSGPWHAIKISPIDSPAVNEANQQNADEIKMCLV